MQTKCEECGMIICFNEREDNFCSFKCKDKYYREKILKEFISFVNSLNSEQFLYMDKFLGQYPTFEVFFDETFLNFTEK